MRPVLTSIMAVLVIAALFLGNCFSCPQLLLAQQKHGCCPHEKAKSSDCRTQVLKSFVKAEKNTAAPAAAVVSIAACTDIMAALPPVVLVDRDHSAYTPPPLQLSLRI